MLQRAVLDRTLNGMSLGNLTFDTINGARLVVKHETFLHVRPHSEVLRISQITAFLPSRNRSNSRTKRHLPALH